MFNVSLGLIIEEKLLKGIQILCFNVRVPSKSAKEIYTSTAFMRVRFPAISNP